MLRFFLALFLLIVNCQYLTISALSCYNEAGDCTFTSTTVKCNIRNNGTEQIGSLLTTCSSSSERYTTLYVYKQYYSNPYGDIVVRIDLPSNIKRIFLNNDRDHDYFRLATSTQNTALTYFAMNYPGFLESNDFFNNFIGLKSIKLQKIYSQGFPSFTNLHDLTYLKVRISGERNLTNAMFTGLDNLLKLDISHSDFSHIAGNAFQPLINLEYLSINYNKIHVIEYGSLNSLNNLIILELEGNEIRWVSTNAFRGLSKLLNIQLDRNPNFPLEALLPLRNLRNLYLNFNNYSTIDPFVFQQFTELSRVYVENPLTCDCRLQWAAQLSQHGIYVYGDCLDPMNVFGTRIINPLLYTNCTQIQSYKCFDKSISCPDNKLCIDTRDDYECGCVQGYTLNSIGDCQDINECSIANNCEYSCINLVGSYHCTCQDGYKLANDGYNCEDVDECQFQNGGCETGCGNTVGSYQCYCEFGHKIYNLTECTDTNEFLQTREELGMLTIAIGEYNSSLENATKRFELRIADCQDELNFTVAELTKQNSSFEDSTKELNSTILNYESRIQLLLQTTKSLNASLENHIEQAELRNSNCEKMLENLVNLNSTSDNSTPKNNEELPSNTSLLIVGSILLVCFLIIVFETVMFIILLVFHRQKVNNLRISIQKLNPQSHPDTNVTMSKYYTLKDAETDVTSNESVHLSVFKNTNSDNNFHFMEGDTHSDGIPSPK